MITHAIGIDYFPRMPAIPGRSDIYIYCVYIYIIYGVDVCAVFFVGRAAFHSDDTSCYVLVVVTVALLREREVGDGFIERCGYRSSQRFAHQQRLEYRTVCLLFLYREREF